MSYLYGHSMCVSHIAISWLWYINSRRKNTNEFQNSIENRHNSNRNNNIASHYISVNVYSFPMRQCWMEHKVDVVLRVSRRKRLRGDQVVYIRKTKDGHVVTKNPAHFIADATFSFRTGLRNKNTGSGILKLIKEIIFFAYRKWEMGCIFVKFQIF